MEQLTIGDNLVNLCPHDIRIQRDDGTEVLLPRQQKPARIIIRSSDTRGVINGINIKGPAEYLRISDLPEPKEGTIYIVSQITALAAQALLDRDDIVYPGTYQGDKPIRGTDGKLQAVRCLVQVK